ncbi:MAG: hypothetical protein Kow0031_10870 [Anaerolineae bacterium]
MDDQTHNNLRNSLIHGGPPAYVVIQMKLHNFAPAARHYFNAPLPLLTPPQSAPLPIWLRTLVYVDRLDLLVEEHQFTDVGPGAAPADALLYLLSAPADRPSEWHNLLPPAAHDTLSRQGDWLLSSERQQLLQLLGCRPSKARGGQFNNLQLLQIWLREWLLRQAYSELLVCRNGFVTEELAPDRVSGFQYYASAGDFSFGQTLRAEARRRFPADPAGPPSTTERRPPYA